MSTPAFPASRRRDIAIATLKRLSQHYLWLLAGSAILLLLYRLGLMLVLPLADSTEARYGEIARLTVQHGFWLMPHEKLGLPFFAKPPLSTWVSALSISAFGLNEFAARLPSLPASLIGAGIAFAFARALKIRQCWLVIPVLAASPLFFISAGAVMTDATQMMIVCSAQYCAWRIFDATNNNRPTQLWKFSFWALIGVAMLSKGLASWALIGLPLIAYGVLERKPWQMFLQIWDWRGALLAACIFVPWYAAAEHFYPGFIDYFIVGEHFKRFLIPNWHGDRYGFAHAHPLGFIWLYWIAGILPWAGVFVSELSRLILKRRSPTMPLERFLWCATLTPLVFFTFAHNIIWTYGLTAIVPFSVLVARWLENASPFLKRITGVSLFALTIGFILFAPMFYYSVNSNSDRDLVAAFKKAAPAGTTLVYREKPEFSSSFYTQGNSCSESSEEKENDQSIKFLVVGKADLASLAPSDKILFTGKQRVLVERQ